MMTEKSRKAISAIVMLAALAGSGAAWYLGWPLLAIGIFGCCYAWVARQVFPKQRFWRIAFSGMFLLVGVPALLAGLQQLRCRYQPRPAPEQVTLFDGVEYIREVLAEPQPAVIHILKVDLAAEEVEVLVTPPDFPGQDYPLRARTTSAFFKEYKLQAAINASNFFPFERENPLSYLTFTCGDKTVLGGAASRGVAYGEPSPYYPILHISEDNRAGILDEWPESPYTATAGIKHFIRDGQAIHMSEREPDARTVVGVDESGRVLFLVVVDGDQAPYSAGTDRVTLTEVLLRQGVYNALGLDGGGSSTMVIEGDNGSARLVNRPVQGTIPDIERPVANHIGIYARRLVDE